MERVFFKVRRNFIPYQNSRSMTMVLMCAFSKQFGVLLACFSTIDFHTIFTASAWLTPVAHTNTHTNKHICLFCCYTCDMCVLYGVLHVVHILYTNERTNRILVLYLSACKHAKCARATDNACPMRWGRD